MYNVGTILRKAREQAGFKKEEIAKKLHVKVEYIEALEKNDFSIFRSSAYIKGLVRNYSQLVGVDYEKILPFLRRQLDTEIRGIPNKLTPIHIRTVQLGYVHLLILGLVLFIGFGLFYITRAYIRSIKPPRLEILEPSGDEVVVESPLLTVKGVTEERTIVYINGEEVKIDENFTFSKEISLNEGENIIHIKAKKTYVKDRYTEKTIKAIYQPTQAEKPKEGVKRASKLVVEVRGQDAWILVRIDKTQADVGIKKDGYSKEFFPTSSFEIITGKPSVTKVFLNSEPLSWKITPNRIFISCSYQDNGWVCE